MSWAAGNPELQREFRGVILDFLQEASEAANRTQLEEQALRAEAQRLREALELELPQRLEEATDVLCVSGLEGPQAPKRLPHDAREAEEGDEHGHEHQQRHGDRDEHQHGHPLCIDRS